MPWIANGDPYQTPESAADPGYSSQTPVDVGSGLAEQAKSAFDSGIGALARVSSEGQFAGSTPFQRALYDTATEDQYGQPNDPTAPASGSVQTSMLQPADYNKMYAPTGPDGKPVSLGDQPMPEGVAKIIGDAKKEEMERDSILSRYEATTPRALTFATGLAASIVDPFNDAAMLIPGIGEEAILARVGSGFIGRTAARLGAGAVTGAATQAPLSAMRYGLSQQEDQDYTLRSAFSDMAYGAVNMAIFHAGGGAAGELLGKAIGLFRARTPEPELSQPQAPDSAPIVAAPPVNPAIADTATGERVEASTPQEAAVAIPPEVDRQVAAILGSAGPTRADAMRVSITQLATGRPIDVEPFFPDLPEAGNAQQSAPAPTIDLASMAQNERLLQTAGYAQGVSPADFAATHEAIMAPKEAEPAGTPPQGPAVAPHQVPMPPRMIDLSPEQLQQQIDDVARRDNEKMIAAFGADGANEFNRLDRARNSIDPRRAGAASDEFDAKFGNLTPEQERAAYGIGDPDPTVDDLRTMLLAHHDFTDTSDEEVARVLTRGMLDSRPKDLRAFMQGGAATAPVQASALRIRSALQEMADRGMSREQIDAATTAAMAQRGFSPEDAREVLSSFRQSADQEAAPKTPVGATPIASPASEPEPVAPPPNKALTREIVDDAGAPHSVTLPDENHALLVDYAHALESEAPGSQEGLDAKAADLYQRFSPWVFDDFKNAGDVDSLASEYLTDLRNGVTARNPSPPGLVVDPDYEADYLRAGYGRTAAPQAGGYTLLDPSELKLDPDRFQYKAADERGLTGALAGTDRWEPSLANPITAWRDASGDTFVVNGHQRTDLAQRAQAAGQQGVQIPARVFNEADGYSPEFMRALGAYQNIAEGSGTAIDAAKVMRAGNVFPDGVQLPGLPPKSQLVDQAKGLAALDEKPFGMVVNQVVPAAYAAEVGKAITDPAEQLAAMDVLAKANPANLDQARSIVQDVRESGYLKGSQTNLFGDEDFAQSLFGERARILDNAQRQLRQIKGAFGTAVDQEGVLTSAGNTLSREANLQGKTTNAQLLETIRSNGTRRGPISDALSDAARDLSAGRPIASVTKQFLDRARDIESGGHGEGLQPSALAGGDRPQEQHAGGEPATQVATDRTEQGDQLVIPGAERSAVQAAASREAAGGGRLRAEGSQKPADEGLFGDGAREEPPGLFGRPGIPETNPEATAMSEAEQQILRLQASGAQLHPDDVAELTRTAGAMRDAEAKQQAFDEAANCLKGAEI